MITNRFDYRMSGPHAGVGVGYQLLEAGAFDPIEVELALQLIEFRRRIHGAGVVVIDCGANIGIHRSNGQPQDRMGIGHRDRGTGANLLCAGGQHRHQQLLQRYRHACRSVIGTRHHGDSDA
ncbi:MAG TPA: hypothetical protein VFN84_06155 [Pseudolabrys sp.]|nr:hypothetical protein [Pseudolabrys sp.]